MGFAAACGQLQGGRAVIADAFARAVTDESIAYVVAAVITRSGWVFRPVLFEFQTRA